MTRDVFAAPIPQEFSSMIELIARDYGVKVFFSPIACRIGELGLYAEFQSVRLKNAFLEAIEGMFIPSRVWAA